MLARLLETEMMLAREIEQLINERMETDIYQSPREVLYEALKLLKERDERLARIRAEVQACLETPLQAA